MEAQWKDGTLNGNWFVIISQIRYMNYFLNQPFFFVKGRIGINGVLLLSGIAIYGIFLWAYGIHNTDQLLQKLKITKNSNPMDVLFLYVSNALVYSFDRLLVNGLLILIAMLDYMIGG